MNDSKEILTIIQTTKAEKAEIESKVVDETEKQQSYISDLKTKAMTAIDSFANEDYTDEDIDGEESIEKMVDNLFNGSLTPIEYIEKIKKRDASLFISPIEKQKF